MRSMDFWFYEIEVSLVEDQIWLWILVWYDLIFLPNIPSVTTASPGGTWRYIHTWLRVTGNQSQEGGSYCSFPLPLMFWSHAKLFVFP